MEKKFCKEFVSEMLSNVRSSSDKIVEYAVSGIVDICRKFGNFVCDDSVRHYLLNLPRPNLCYVDNSGFTRVAIVLVCNGNGVIAYCGDNDCGYKFKRDELAGVFLTLCKMFDIEEDTAKMCYSLYCLDENGCEVDCADWICCDNLFSTKADAMNFVAVYGYGLGLTRRKWGIKAVSVKDEQSCNVGGFGGYADTYTSPYGQLDECCGECGSEVTLDCTFRLQVCPKCGKFIIPCSICDADLCNCTHCPLVALKNALMKNYVTQKVEKSDDFSYNDVMKRVLG